MKKHVKTTIVAEIKTSHNMILSAETTHRPRRTLATTVTTEGRGVHSGEISSLTLLPANSGAGIVFQRTDLPGQPTIPADLQHLAEDELLRRTTLSIGRTKVHTIEHVLSALAACAIDDCTVQLDTAEPPFLDGSALPFVKLIQRAGTQESGGAISYISIPTPMSFAENGSEICAIPSEEFRVTFFYSSDHPQLQSQSQSFAINEATYAAEIASARTFCFFEEIEALRKANLIKGANLASAVVFGRKAIINESLRFPDEPVRHKILDFIGDLALLGSPLKGHFMAWRSGHRVNAAFGLYLRKELGL